MNIDSFLIVILNALAYVITLCVFWKHHKDKLICSYIISIWAVCAVGAVFYEPINFYGHIQPITPFPYVFFYCCFLLLIYPTTKYDDYQIRSVNINTKKFAFIAIILGIISIPPFFESLLYLVKTGGNTSTMLDMFNERYEDTSSVYHYLSNVSKKCTYILHGTRLFSLFALFYWPMIKCKYHKTIFIGICFANSLIFLEATILLARFQIVAYALLGFFVFLLIQRAYPQELKKSIIKVLKVIGLIFAIVIILQTTLRLENFQDKSTNKASIAQTAYALQYLSEGMGNFNGNLYYSDYRIGYSPIIKFYFNLCNIDLPPHSGTFEKRFHTNQFFTVIGDYWRSYGPFITVLLLLLYSILMKAILKSPLSSFSMAKILTYLMYAKMLLMGPFYHAYFIDSSQLFYTPLLIVFFSISFNTKQKKQ